MLLMSIVATDPDPVSMYRKDLPPALAELIMKCLEKDLDRRVQTMRDLELGLAAFAEVDVAPELVAPGAREPGESAADKYKATALARKKPRAEMEPDGPSGTRPDGSFQGPASPATVVLQTNPGTRDQAPANATMAKPVARESISTPSDSPVSLPTSNRGMLVAGALGLLLAAGGLAAAAGAFSSEPPAPLPTTGTRSTSPVTPPVVPPTVPVPTEPARVQQVAPAQEVRIRIRVEPADARILIGGVEYPNPLDAPQVRSLTPTQVRIEREGYRAIEQLVVFSEDQSLMFQMSRGRGTEQRGTPAAGGTTTMTQPAVTMEAPTMEATTTMDPFRGWE